ncbi:3'(2'),5'-bisphosphate nucleotidase CysQ [Roseomonas sp. OT10]|uniref:3'(2'),5'-bisphosphate nucleotidase CysQ n=1 Tax=Roseomonas cutis TaxID=2897332 RepID=UPI001E35D188|nr:3'(2'),5'-bisphosphate nucleotidase CysQ [Roseomonas sp. OT10]UFN50048.1 3'(2'),5'-bisphosphate nucleotidase CysQ [Roseomonas sp. OT10]
MTDPELLELAASLARRAADAINAIRAAGFAVERKSDASPVTEADRVAEALIVEGLRAATPDIPVVAEEEVCAGVVTRLAHRYWLVDPLDGTREFAAGRDSFAVCIGLVEGDRPVLGAVAIPPTGEVFGGLVATGDAAGGTAWKEDAAGRRAIAARVPPAEGLTVMFSRHSMGDPRLAPFLEGWTVAEVVNCGSAVKFCRLAEGAADLYPRFGRTMEWDTAAGQALLEAAGGRLLDAAGQPLRYGKPGFENGAFVAWGRAAPGPDALVLDRLHAAGR